MLGRGINSITLKGNETIEVTDEACLEEINTEKSNKYIAEGGILYAKNADSSKGSPQSKF